MRKMMKLVCALLAVTASWAVSADLYVKIDKGQKIKTYEGMPVIAWPKAVKMAKPGDTLHLIPTKNEVFMTLTIQGLSGTEGNPITIDGGNNVLIGVSPLEVANWEQDASDPKKFSMKKTMADYEAIRFFMVRNGKRIRMGRWTKRKSAPWKAVDALNPGEFTLTKGEAGEKPHNFEYTITVMLPEDCEDLASAGFQMPRISWQNGVTLRKNASHLVIKNLIVRDFLNDGFNVHDTSTDVLFENVAAIDCGDDGYSLHNGSSASLDKFVSIGNSTAIVHIGKVQATHKNVYSEEEYGLDLQFRNVSNTIEDSVFVSILPKPYDFAAGKAPSSLTLKNVVFCGKGKSSFSLQTNNLTVTAENVKVAGLRGAPEDYEKIPLPEAKKLAEAKKAELFAGFGGRLEKVMENR